MHLKEEGFSRDPRGRPIDKGGGPRNFGGEGMQLEKCLLVGKTIGSRESWEEEESYKERSPFTG